MKKGKISLIFQFFYSYVLCLLFPLLVFVTAILIYTQTTMKSNTLEAYSSIQDANCRNIENLYYQIHNSAFRLAYENEVYRLDSTQYADPIDLNFLVQSIMKKLRISNSLLYKSNNVELSLYFDRNDTVVSTSSKYAYEEYMSDQLGSVGIQIEAAYLREAFERGEHYLLLPNQSGDHLVYVFPMEVFGSDSRTYILATIPALSLLANGMEDFPHAIYRNGTMLCANQSALGEIPAAPQKGSRLRLGGGAYYAIPLESSLLGLSYLTCVDVAVVSHHLRYTYLLIILLAMTTVGLGLMFSWVLSKYNYRPIRSILSALEPYRGSSRPDPREYEVVQINDTLRRLVANNTQLQDQIAEQLPVLQNAFLDRLLKDPFPVCDSLDGKLYGLEFLHPTFGVLLGRVEQKHADFASDVLKSLLSTIVSSHHPRYSIYTVNDTNNTLSILVNFSPPHTLEELAQKLRRMLPNYLLLSCSQAAHGLEELHNAYKQAVEAMGACFLNGTLLSLYAMSDSHVGYLSFPPDKEIALCNCIKEKLPQKAREQIDSILNDNIRRNAHSASLINILFFDLLAALLKAASETSLDPEQLWNNEKADQFSTASGEQRAQMLYKLSDCICDKLIMPEKSHAGVLKAKLLQYIHEHYNNPELSLNMIAQNFNISPQYLSSFFKTQVNKNYIDYLNQYRLKNALELLKDDRLSVREISVKVGYTDAGNFIRVFKKYYSITPGQYRES